MYVSLQCCHVTIACIAFFTPPCSGSSEFCIFVLYNLKQFDQKTPGELGVSKSMECDIIPFSALTLLAERQEGHLACKKTGCWFVGGDELTGALHDL